MRISGQFWFAHRKLYQMRMDFLHHLPKVATWVNINVTYYNNEMAKYTTPIGYSLIMYLFIIIYMTIPQFRSQKTSKIDIHRDQNSHDQIHPDWIPLRVLTANVGNLSLGCGGKYNHKLCHTSVEVNIANNIKEINPDIVFFQELLDASQCEGWVEMSPNKSCYKFDEIHESNQARRLLGDQYSIACFTRTRKKIGHPVGLECIAVSKNIGQIEDCDYGGLCYDIGRKDLPLNNCNPEFVVSSVIANLGDVRIALVNAHPNSRQLDCRLEAIQQIFRGSEGNLPLASEMYTLIAGDFNFDPFREKGALSKMWALYVGEYGTGKPYYYHSGPKEHRPPYFTVFNIINNKTFDHILSNFALGSCQTLGVAPGTKRLDSGRGMDHRAVMGDLWIPPK